ncbi:hydroxypyruvate isomerase [Streptomyces aurantiacus]|uniref:TIM barrel protein n=1 Tax=Streptomyces aurantiacus TaxID=47760 RepID=UPI0027906525|nr:TIM barrel protein [Streptomyces aurantiacus]MDQ0772798.1 hydroxypyruvate isomerase [Streptomyces aurantiacus]
MSTTGPATGDRYALNLSLPPLRGRPLGPRMEAAAVAGFSLVETWWPFPTPQPGKAQAEEVRAALADAGTRLVCMNIDAGDMASGERGILSDPGRRRDCALSITAAVEFASSVGCRLLNLPYGNRLPQYSREEQHRTAHENLLLAAELANGHGISVLIEALNPLDNPDYLLPDVDMAAGLVRRTRREGAAATGLLLDVYHLARMGQDPVDAIGRHGDALVHVQFADVPGRICPGTGGLDFTRVVEALRTARYDGLVGLEFDSRAGSGPSEARSFVSRHPLGDTGRSAT